MAFGLYHPGQGRANRRMCGAGVKVADEVGAKGTAECPSISTLDTGPRPAQASFRSSQINDEVVPTPTRPIRPP